MDKKLTFPEKKALPKTCGADKVLPLSTSNTFCVAGSGSGLSQV
jgi:hypothetical protein